MSTHDVADQSPEYVDVVQDDRTIRLWLKRPSGVDFGSDAAALLAQLLAPLLGDASGPVASALIASFGSLTAVLAADSYRLAGLPGVSKATVHLIKSAHAVGVWSAGEAIKRRDVISSSHALENYVRTKLRCAGTESAVGLFLDRKNQLIDEVLLGCGTVDHVTVYPRDVVRHAILLHASAVILVHNHPSGDPVPSPADIDLTRRIAKALVAVDVAFHDHLIVGDGQIVSMRASRRL